MVWGLLAASIVAFWIYRFLSGDIRKASKIIAYHLNVKPPFITEFIGVMRTDPSPGLVKMTRQQYYCRSVVQAHGNIEQLSSYIKTFYIYQVLKNPHDENVSWWANRIKGAGFDVQITELDRQCYEMFFDVDHLGFKKFVSAHNQMVT